MKRWSWLPIPLCLTIACIAFWLSQGDLYSNDPPNQTDRIFYKGWPRPYQRIGGFAGFKDWYPAAFALDLAVFVVPGVCLGIAATTIMRRSGPPVSSPS